MADDLEQLKQSILGIKTNPWDNLDPSSIPRGTKLEELNVAAKQKYAILNSLKADKERDAASWSSQLGVRHMPVTSGAVDLAASLVSGASRTLGHIGTAIGGLEYTANDARLSDADRASMQKFMQGTLSKEEESRMFTPDNSGMSPAARYRESQKIVERVAKLRDTFDITSITNATDRNAFHEDISKVTQSAQESFDSGDTVTGLAKLLVGGGKSILTNTKAVSEYVAENLPQLFMGAAGTVGKAALTASNIGYASDEFVKGIEAYSKANNGALPTDEVRNEMALKAASLAIAENVGELAQLGAISKAKKSAEGFLKTVGKATGTGALNEGLTEAYQTGIENNLQGKEVKWEDVYEGGLIGAASGGALSGTGAAASKGAEILGEAVQRGEEDRALTEAVKTAIETGDTSAIRDPESPTYAPHKVVDVAIGKAVAGEVTSEEKQATYKELDSIQKELENKKVELEDSVIPVSEEVKAIAQSAIDAATEQLQEYQTKMEIYRPKMEEKGLSTEEIDTKLNALFGDQIEAANAEIQNKQKILDKKVLTPEESTQEIKKIDAQLSYLSNRRSELGNLYSQVKPENVKTLVDEVTTTQIKPEDIPAVEESVSKVGKILTFAMANSDNVSGEQAAKLAATEVGTTPEQRAFFGNHAKAKEAEAVAKTMQGVNKEIFLGEEKGFMGIDKYRREFANAFESTNKSAAIELYRNLQTFALSHQSKGKAIQEAMKMGEDTHILRDAKTGTWSVLPERMSDTKFKELRKQGVVLNVNAGSKNLLDAVSAEYGALKALANESRSGIKAVFTTTAPTSSLKTTDTVSTVPVKEIATAASTQVTAAIPEVSNLTQTPEIPNGTQTTETKQTEAQGQEQQQGQANVTAVESPRVVVGSDSSNWVNTNAQISRNQSDKAGLTAEVESSFAEGLTAKEVFGKIKNKLGFVEGSMADKMNWVVQVRATLGIPSQSTQEGKVEFDKWKQEYLARNAVSPAQNQEQVTGTTSLPTANNVVEVTSATKAVDQNLSTEQVENTSEAKNEDDLFDDYEFTDQEEIEVTSEATTEVKTKPKKEGKVSAISVSTKGMKIQDVVDNGKLLARYVTQKGSQLPLLQVKDFLTQWVGNKVSALDFLKVNKEDLSEKQVVTIRTVRSTLPQWVDTLTSIISTEKKADASTLDNVKNIFSELISKDGSIDENVKTAMAVAGMLFLSKNGNYNPQRDTKRIIKMVGIAEDNIDWFEEKNDAGVMGMLSRTIGTEEVVQIELGNMIGDILGLENKDDRSPEDLLPRLKASMGVYALEMMKNLGMVEVATYTQSEKMHKGKVIPVTGNAINFPRDDQGIIEGEVGGLINAFTGVDNIVESLFGAEASILHPTAKPVPFKKETTQGTENEIPKALKESVSTDNASPRRADAGILTLMSGMGKELVLKVAGSLEEQKDKLPADMREAASDKHRGLESEYDLVYEALENTHLDSELGLFERDFFVQSTVLGIQRLNMVTRSLNPMASKIHRNMFYSPAWDTEITAESTDLIDILKVSIATGIGLNPDTNHQTDLISELDSKAKNDPVFSKVLPLIEKVLFPKEAGDAFVFQNKENESLLLQATPEGMMSLKALVSWAQLLHAERTGFAEPLHTNQMFGIDGKVNGTALAHASLGIDDINLVGPQTGFYPLNPDRPDSPKNFVEYATKKGLDVYQNTMSTILGMLGVLPQSYKDKYTGSDSIVRSYNDTLSSVKFIVGNLGDVVTKTVEKAGRDLVKTPITALHFGSGLKSVTKSASKDFITRYLKKVEKEFAAYGDHSIEGNKEKDLEVTAELVKALNTIMKNSLTSTTELKAASLKDLLNLELSKSQLAALREGFEDTLGDRISEGFATQFEDYLDKRNALVSGASVTYAMYMALKTQYTKEIIDKGIASGRLGVIKSAKGDTVYAAYDLSKKQKKYVEMKLGKAMPRVHTVLSKREGTEGNIKAGLMLAKSKVGINKSSEYRSDVLIKDASGETRKVNVAAEGFFDESPGVNPASATIHSLESAIMQLTRAHFEGALNINDELGIGIGQAKEAANKINEYTATLIAEYNPLVEILNTGVGVLGVFAWQNESIDLMRGFVANLDQKTKDIYRYATEINLDYATDLEVFTFIESTFNNLRNAAVLGEHTKNTFLSTLGYVDQYPMEGAQYVVPDSYRAAAAERIKGDHLQPTKDKLKNTLMSLKKKVKSAGAKTKPVEVTPLVAPVIGEDISDDLNDAEEFSIEASNRAHLVSTLESLKPVNALKFVKGQLADTVLPYESLAKIGNLLPDNLVIRIVSEAESKLIEGVPEGSVKGWFTHNTGTNSNEIYLVRELFTEETVAHEIVHAALVQAIELAKTGKHPDATKLVQEIEVLISITKNAKGADKFSAAFENVHEFVTWGLTNEEFQEFLTKFEFRSANRKNSFVSAMRDFFDMVFNYLFKDVRNTALEAMFMNAFGLAELGSTMQANPKLFENISNKGSNITLSMANQAKQSVDTYTTEDIYNALGTVKPGFSDSFDTHLRNLLGGVVKALRGPFGSLTQAEMVNQTITPLDVWTNSIVTGKAPLVSKLSKAGVRMTAQERFVAQQVEAVMNDAMRNPDVRVSAAMQEMIKLFNSAKTRLKPENFYKGNWNKATAQNKRKAEAMYNFLFNVKSVDGRSDYLGNFAALGLGSEVVNKALNLPSRTEVKKDLIGKSIADTLANVFEFLLNLYTDLASKTTQDMPMNMKLYSLVNTLVNIDAKKKNVLKRQIESKVDPILDAIGKKASTAIRKHLVKLLNHPAFSKNRLATVRATAAGARLFLEDRIPMFMDTITKMRNEFDTQKHGVAMNLFNDVKGYGKRINAFIRSATALNAEREHIASQLSKIVISGFKDNGDYLTKDDHAAITGGLLRTGAHVLLNKPGMTMKGIAELLEDNTKLDSSISVIEKELIKRFRNKANYFIHQSKGLAALMVLGKSMNPAGQLTNALLISQEANGSPNKLSETDQKAAEAMIDELSTLYAFKYQEMNTEGFNASLATLIKGEEDKEGGAVSGILEAMTLQAKLNEDVKSTLFEGSDVLMRKGYLPEIINPHTSFEIAGTDAATAKDYADRGFDEGKPVLRDPQDSSTEAKAMYVLRDGAPSAWVSGGVQLDSNKAKGTSVIGKNRNLNSFEGMMNAAELADVSNAKQRLVANTYTSSSLAWNPLQQSSVDYMVPLFNANGKIVNWRYEMSHEERDNMLGRDNRVQEVISTMAATTFGKESASQQNKAIVEALHQDYKRNFNLNREHFIYVSPLSEDKELKNIWNVLPYQMKQDIKETTGDGKGLWIRKTYLLPVFGYRKYSLSEIWTKEDKLNMAEEAFKTVAEWLLSTYARTVLRKSYQESEDYAKRAYIYVRRGQRAWEEIVAQVKDIVVIRTGTVMLGNIISNFSLLKANGIPMSDIIKNHHVAIKAYKQFDANSQELFELMTERKLGFLRGEAAAKESRINQLEDAINTSPIKKLIDAGLRPSIVEDLADIDDQYSYKSAFVDNMDKYVNKINPTVRNVANQLLVTKNSELYKALSKTTQMSDFVARYVLFEHLTKRKDNPLTDKEAIFEVGEAFINYDIPMAKGLQFIDDMGFTPFVKYFMRIQRVLLKAAKDHPMQMLGLVTLNHFFSSLPLVTDSSFVAHIGNNPFRSGAGQILTVWDDTVVLETLSKLVK